VDVARFFSREAWRGKESHLMNAASNPSVKRNPIPAPVLSLCHHLLIFELEAFLVPLPSPSQLPIGAFVAILVFLLPAFRRTVWAWGKGCLNGRAKAVVKNVKRVTSLRRKEIAI